MDPLEFRRLNAAVEGDRRPDGPVYPRIGFLETVEAAMNSAHYRTPLGGQEFAGAGWHRASGSTAAASRAYRLA